MAAAWLAVATCAHAEIPVSEVVRVLPTAHQVPANLLRVSIEFSAPVGGGVLSRLSLSDVEGHLLESPFLQQELWSPDGKVLTVLMHPARVKTGLNAREVMGPILTAGERVWLALDARPLKQWDIGPADEEGPDTAAWTIADVRGGTLQPLVVMLDDPIDARDVNYLAVVDSREHLVRGHASLSHGETIWSFKPERPWGPGEYKLVVRGTLEDAAGNRMGARFESPIASQRRPLADVVLPFRIQASDPTASGERRRDAADNDKLRGARE